MDKRTQTPGFRSVPRTGVIYVMHEAMKQGYAPESVEGANLEQGADARLSTLDRVNIMFVFILLSYNMII